MTSYTMTNNQELSRIFDHMADLFLLGGNDADKYRISSYRRVAQIIRYLPKDAAEIAKEGNLKDIPGVGDAISEKIQEFLKTGKIKAYEELKGKFPETLLALMDIPSLGPKKVQLLWKELGVVDKTTLQKVLTDGTAEELPGFGKKTVENILQGIGMEEKLKERKLLGEMMPIEQMMREYLKKSKLTIQLEAAGSFRRREETIGDLDFLATSKKPKELIHYFIQHPLTIKVLAEGDTKGSIILKGDQQVDLRVVAEDEWGAALQYFTGSKEHNVHVRTLARERKRMINEYGVFKLTKDGKKGKKIAGKTEPEVYKALGMQYMPPEMRTDTGEVEAAFKKVKLPKLIEGKDIKGDLHAHTTCSDGIHTIEQMAKKADELGIEYLAMTDHSPSLIVANGCTPKRLKEKKKEMDRVQKMVKVKLLTGTEVDILADGSLDYSDEILEELDVVVASVHSQFTKDNTKRILKAMEHPFVNIIGHLSGRMIGTRNAYPLDFDAVFKKAVETGTWIEINAQPARQDLSWDHLRRAKEFGVKFVISTDSHSMDSLWYRELGAAIARRGWLTKEDVMNTLPKEKFLKALHAQRKKKVSS